MGNQGSGINADFLPAGYIINADVLQRRYPCYVQDSF